MAIVLFLIRVNSLSWYDSQDISKLVLLSEIIIYLLLLVRHHLYLLLHAPFQNKNALKTTMVSFQKSHQLNMGLEIKVYKLLFLFFTVHLMKSNLFSSMYHLFRDIVLLFLYREWPWLSCTETSTINVKKPISQYRPLLITSTVMFFHVRMCARPKQFQTVWNVILYFSVFLLTKQISVGNYRFKFPEYLIVSEIFVWQLYMTQKTR